MNPWLEKLRTLEIEKVPPPGTAKTVETYRDTSFGGFDGSSGCPFFKNQPFAQAFEAMERSCPDRVEDPRRWHRAVEDARRFLVAWGEKAEARGWTADDLFGLDEIAPLWLLRGRPVIALTDASATIRTRTGGALTYPLENKQFAALRLRGEWFRREGALADFVAQRQL